MIYRNDLAYWSAREIADGIKAREFSPVEVVDACIERIEERNPSLNAFVFFGFDDARSAAKRAEQDLIAGHQVGPLHGVPVAIKDLFSAKPGWITTFGGVIALRNNVVNYYSVFAERIQRGGAILLGKTNSPTMGFRGTCDNFLFGPTRNPFDLERNSGGSSGGSAAAVADGMVPLAEGTDAGGSIRIPAAWCGCYGYKPSFGLLPFVVRPNAFMADTPFLFEGPITRTVEDARLALSVLSGFDSRDPFSLGGQQDLLVGAEEKDLTGWRIAFSADLDVFPVQPEIKEMVARSTKIFETAGAVIDEVKINFQHSQAEMSDLWCRLLMPAYLAIHRQMKEQGIDIFEGFKDHFPPQYVEWIEKSANMSVVAFYQDQEIRTSIYDSIEAVFKDYDLLVCPTVACQPVVNAADGNTTGPSMICGEKVDSLIGWCLTYLFNLTGHPAASVPIGLDADGLPVGMQIVGRKQADEDVLRASEIVEQLQPWIKHFDKCAQRIA